MEKHLTHRRYPVLLFVLLTAPFYQIGYLVDTVSWVGKAYTLWQMAAGILVAVLVFRGRLLRKIPPIFILFAALLSVLCMASAVNGGSMKRALQYSFGTLVVCLVAEVGLLTDLRHFILAQMLFFGTLTLGNFCSILLFPDGMYKYLGYYWDSWFLGFKSGHITYQLQFLYYSVLYTLYYDHKKRYLVLLGLAVIYVSSFLVKNRTALLILIPIIMTALFPGILKVTCVMNSLVYATAGIVMELLFVVFRRQDLFKWLIVGVFHRNLNLTYRVDVWDLVFKTIREHPVIGHGYQTFVYTPSPEIITTHNEVLEILYKEGVIGLIIFVGILGAVVFRLFRYRRIPSAQWTALFLGAFFLMFVMEQYAFSHFFYLLVFTWHCEILKDAEAPQLRGRRTDAG